MNLVGPNPQFARALTEHRRAELTAAYRPKRRRSVFTPPPSRRLPGVTATPRVPEPRQPVPENTRVA